MIGKTISHYRILEKLGEGGMGVVYKAEDENLHRPVALKFLRADAIDDRQSRGRFSKEAEAAAALDHPNITTIYEIAAADSQTFIAMALIDGENLAAKIKRRPLPLDEALQIASQVAEALQAAHERGIVHRDIKPGNIMVTPRGQVKVMDFGLAHLAGQTRITKTGTIMGTPAYMSPEQAQGQPLDQRSDIWSLGAVLYEMVTGQLPFRGDSDHAMLRAILDDLPEPMTAIRVGTPPELDRIAVKTLEKDPDTRYQHADELLADLKKLNAPAHATRPSTPTPPSVRPNRWVLIAAVTALMILAGVVARQLPGDAQPEPAPQYRLSQLTYESGYAEDPAISPDGKLVAYAADRGDSGATDIWIQQVGEMGAVRLTNSPGEDLQPSFSHDGQSVVFYSARNGGGIYTKPALGADSAPRLVVPVRGREPRFAPDGERISYGTYTGAVSRIWVVPAAGGEPRELLAPGLPESGFYLTPPVWLDDNRLLFAPGIANWWIATLDDPLRYTEIEAREALTAHGIKSRLRAAPSTFHLVRPNAWWHGHERAVFSATYGDSTNLWSLPVSPTTGEIAGAPERITIGPGPELSPSVSANGRIVFSDRWSNVDIVSAPADANNGRITGELQHLTADPARDMFPSMSGDGNSVAYLSDRSGRTEVWLLDVETRRTRQLTHSGARVSHTSIAPDGNSVAYGNREQGRGISVVSTRGGTPVKVAEQGNGASDWFPDSERLVAVQNGKAIMVNVRQRETSELLNVYALDPQVSPDGRWVAYHKFAGPWVRQVMVAPVEPTGGRPDASESIALTDGQWNADRPFWSPDGKLVYFVSERDGRRCLWARRFDVRAAAPVGPPFAVYHAHEPTLELASHVEGGRGAAVAGRIMFTVTRTTGNIWMLDPIEGAAP